MKIKKILSLVLSLALGTVALAGCGAGGGNGGQESAAKAPRELNVVLDWYPNALHTFLYTAIERGYYAQEGLDVKIRFPANENDALTLVSAGKAEIGLYYEHDIIQAAVNQGVRVRSIGAVVQHPLNVVLSLADRGIRSPADLAGKTVGYAGTALSEALVRTMMAADGADPDSAEMVNVGFELMSAMTTGNVDATIGCLVNHEVPQLEEEGFEVNYFPVNGYGVPDYYEAVFLASQALLDSEPETVAAFLRASARGFADFRADPEGCLGILLDHQSEENFPLSPAVERQSCAALLPLMETEDAPFLSQTRENWQSNIDWMYSAGLIDRAIDAEELLWTPGGNDNG